MAARWAGFDGSLILLPIPLAWCQFLRYWEAEEERENRSFLTYLTAAILPTLPLPKFSVSTVLALCLQALCGEVGAHFSAAPLRQWQSLETLPLFFLQDPGGGQSQAAVLSTAVSAKLLTPTTSLWALTGSIPYSSGSGSSWGGGGPCLWPICQTFPACSLTVSFFTVAWTQSMAASRFPRTQYLLTTSHNCLAGGKKAALGFQKNGVTSLYWTALQGAEKFLLLLTQTVILRLTKCLFPPAVSIFFYWVPMTLYKTICSRWHLSIFTAKKGRAMHFWQDNRIWSSAGSRPVIV